MNNENKMNNEMNVTRPEGYQCYHMNGGKDPANLKEFFKIDPDKEMEKLFKDAPDVDWRHVPFKKLYDEGKITEEEYDEALNIQSLMITQKLHAHEEHFVRDTILAKLFLTPGGIITVIGIILMAILS